MLDIFISYSRKDKAFVRRLADALEAQGRETWVDWDDIRPAEDFTDAIYSGIEQARIFVFISSPDYVASVSCGRELGHALKNNKRLIPIVCREIEQGKVPPALSDLDWILFRDDHNFGKSVERLLFAFDTDYKWVDNHTQLLTRARDWEKKGNNRSMLPRGDDLNEAERIVVQSTGKQPQLADFFSELFIKE
jgi:hypothetical protein